MSFIQYIDKENVIQEGDPVVGYINPKSITIFEVKKGGILHNKFGAFSHNEMIGKPWGTKIWAGNQKGYIYLVHPTPEIWTEALPHRTQILYIADISFISSMLDLMPGKVMIESGTGSGSFSHSIARTIAPTGKLYTFEFHKERAEKAKAEFSAHGLGSVVEANHRDVCDQGFGLENVADAVFLDLPSPWEAVVASKLALKKGVVGRFCSFSPCIEQIQRTCAIMKEQGFFDIRMFETLQRQHDVRTYMERPLPRMKLNPKVAEAVAKKRKAAENGDHSHQDNEQAVAEKELGNVVVSRPRWEVRGHTSYLLFGSVIP